MFDRSYWKRMTFIHLIPYLLYFFGIAFDISAAVTVSGLGLRQAKVPACRGAMYICLVFYVSVKVCVQLFLIERAHAVRYRLKKRLHDALWVVFMLVVFVGFGTIATLAFIAPVDIVDQEDGQCRIGLPRTAVMVLMTYDILINIALTVVFLVLLRPLFRMRSTTHGQTTIRLTEHQFTPPPKFGTQVTSRELSDAPTVETSTTEPPPLQLVTGTATGPNAENIKALIGKTLFGAVIMLVATIINLTLLYRYHGQEHGWLCFMCCLVDVTWTVTIIHMLTEARKEEMRPGLAQHPRGDTRSHETFDSLGINRRAYSEG